MISLQQCRRAAILMCLLTAASWTVMLAPVSAAQTKRATKSHPGNPKKAAMTKTVTGTPIARPGTPLNRRLQKMGEVDAEWEREARKLSDRMRREVEAELKGWKPGKRNDQTPMAALQCTDTKLEGVWSYSTGFGGDAFHFLPAKEETIPVFLITSSCVTLWELKRTARYENGIVVLNRPVKVNAIDFYNRLYTLRVDGKEYLVPDVCLAEFHQALSPDGKRVDEQKIKYITFQRE